jgi:metal-responsive CopG/Arc/MetJ family transcriptional regulator
VKTAVSIPNRIYEAAEQYARRRRIPRSQVYAEALARFMAEQESDEDLTAALNRVCQEVDTGPDEFSKAAARRALARSDW